MNFHNNNNNNNSDILNNLSFANIPNMSLEPPYKQPFRFKFPKEKPFSSYGKNQNQND